VPELFDGNQAMPPTVQLTIVHLSCVFSCNLLNQNYGKWHNPIDFYYSKEKTVLNEGQQPKPRRVIANNRWNFAKGSAFFGPYMRLMKIYRYSLNYLLRKTTTKRLRDALTLKTGQQTNFFSG